MDVTLPLLPVPETSRIFTSVLSTSRRLPSAKPLISVRIDDTVRSSVTVFDVLSEMALMMPLFPPAPDEDTSTLALIVPASKFPTLNAS